MNKPKAIIFDIDGTVATRGDGPEARGPYDWDRVGEDLPNENVMFVARMLGFAAGTVGPEHLQILFFSGRDGCCRMQTQVWLDYHFGYPYKLYMRPDGDNGPDHELKKDLLDAVSQAFNIVAVFDDRNQVVDMWRSEKVTCMQVCSRADGDF